MVVTQCYVLTLSSYCVCVTRRKWALKCGEFLIPTCSIWRGSFCLFVSYAKRYETMAYVASSDRHTKCKGFGMMVVRDGSRPFFFAVSSKSGSMEPRHVPGTHLCHILNECRTTNSYIPVCLCTAWTKTIRCGGRVGMSVSVYMWMGWSWSSHLQSYSLQLHRPTTHFKWNRLWPPSRSWHKKVSFSGSPYICRLRCPSTVHSRPQVEHGLAARNTSRQIPRNKLED